MPKTEPRRCTQCGAPMDRRRVDHVCGPCLTRARIGSLAPTVPPELWRDPALISAIARRDMGAVSRIHRAYTGSSQGDMAAILDLTQPDVSKIENAARVVTELELFIQLVNALGIPPHLTLQAIYGNERPEGAASAPGLRPDDDGDDVLRRSLLFDSAFAAAAVVAPELLGRNDRDGGHRVGATEVATMQQMAVQFRNLDRRLGGRRVMPLLINYLTTTVHSYLRSGASSERTRKAMFIAAADLTRLAGWVAFDAGDMHSYRYLTQAVTLSELADDKAFSADVLVPMGNQLVDLGCRQRATGGPALYGGQVVELAAAGLSATRRCGSPVGQAILHVLEAHGHALTGDEHATAQSLLAAERAIGRADPADQPSWIHGFDRAQMASDAMWCYRNLGKPHQAIRFFEEASAVPSAYARSRCLAQLTVASIWALQQEVDEACRVGYEALSLAGSIPSVRVRDTIQSLLDDLAPFSAKREVREFNHAARRALAALI